jgi:hypothetical protein
MRLAKKKKKKKEYNNANKQENSKSTKLINEVEGEY